MTRKKPGAVRGQPRKADKRAKVIGVRVTNEEHETITTAAGDEGASPFLRRVGLDAARTGRKAATVAGDLLEEATKALRGDDTNPPKGDEVDHD